MKTKEELLREEIRAMQDMMLRIFQWGVTVLVSVQTALYFIRRDVHHDLHLPAGTLLPSDRYLRGTLFLFIIAVLFTIPSNHATRRYRYYREQLREVAASPTGSGIQEVPVRKLSRVFVILLFVFPAFDLFLRFGWPKVILTFE